MTALPAPVNDPPSDTLRERLRFLTLEQKVRLLTGADWWSLPPEPTVGLRRVVLSDGPAGVRGELWDERHPSANVPSPTALAASWDTARVERMGRLLAAEARRKGVDVLLAPGVNLHRTPYGGRHFEYLSEDPYLSARIGSAYVRGVQSGGVAATVKHFVANDSETERFSVDARVDERTLREIYLAPFDAIVREAGVWAVMAAYNSVNGTTMTEHPMLREVLQREWGFDGVTMTDWYAGRSTEAAAEAGLDLIMPGPKGPWGEALLAAVRAGKVSEEAVDDKVLRVLRLAGRVGALDEVPPATPAVTPWSEAEIAAELRASAAAGIVLARNADTEVGPLLPLKLLALRRVAVVGPNAAVARTLGGGSATVFPPYTVSPLQGLADALGPGVQVQHAVGVRSTDRLPAAAVELLRRPDGTGPGLEVRFLDQDGRVLGREQRAGAAFTWMGDFAPGVPVSAATFVEVHTRLHAVEDGTYLIGASGLGSFRLTVDGEMVLDARITLPEEMDPVEAILRPPQRAVSVDLRAGQEAAVVLSHKLYSAGGFGDADLTMVRFQLNAERRPDVGPEEELEQAVALAERSDLAVVVVGTTEEVESEGFDRDSLALPGNQDELVRRVAAVNPRTVVVVNAGAPVLLPWAHQVPAVLLGWFGGQEFGNALADVLLGAVEPGGRLPTTWPETEENLPATKPVNGSLSYDEGLYVGYRAYDRDGREPLYRFGHGLGYTTWEYLAVDAPGTVTDREAVTVEVRVRNTGPREGREVVQVYASRPDSYLERPVRWLAGFAAVDADAGEEATATVRIATRALEHWDITDGVGWTIERGIFRLDIGRSSGDLRLTTEVDVRAAT